MREQAWHENRQDSWHEGRDGDRDDADDGIRTLRRKAPLGRFRLAARVVFAAGAIAGLTIMAKQSVRSEAATQAWVEPPSPRPSARAAAARPVPADLLASLLTYPAEPNDPPVRFDPPRWNAGTGAREDALTQGSFDAIEAPFLRLALVETAPGVAAPASPFVTLARQAAEFHGLSVLRTGMRAQVETKFGAVEISEAVLGAEGQRTCTAFRTRAARNLQIDGWLCGILGQAPEPEAVVCALDRLSLATPAAPTLEAAFAEAQGRRGAACGSPARRVAEVTGLVRNATAPADRGKNEAQIRRIVQARQ